MTFQLLAKSLVDDAVHIEGNNSIACSKPSNELKPSTDSDTKTVNQLS